jgi:hypothetical protein
VWETSLANSMSIGPMSIGPMSIGPMTIERGRSDLNDQLPHVRSEGETNKSFRYVKTTQSLRLLRVISEYLHSFLVDSEGDVLPVVCSIVGQYNRILCYMCCGLPAMNMYKDLVSLSFKTKASQMHLT